MRKENFNVGGIHSTPICNPTALVVAMMALGAATYSMNSNSTNAEFFSSIMNFVNHAPHHHFNTLPKSSKDNPPKHPLLRLFFKNLTEKLKMRLGNVFRSKSKQGAIMHNNITGPWDNLFHFTPETTTVLITVAVLGVTAYLTINRTFFSRKTTVATLNKTGDRVIADRIMLNEQIKHHKLPICFTNLVDGDSEFLGLLTNNENDYISSLVFKSSTITNETIKLLLQFNNLKSVTFIDCHNINDSDLSELKKFEVKTKNCKQIHDVTTPGIPEGETTSKLIS